MIKSKTKMSTLFVVILTIVTILLGAMFMTNLRANQSFLADGDIELVEISSNTIDASYYDNTGYCVYNFGTGITWTTGDYSDFYGSSYSETRYVDNPAYDPSDPYCEEPSEIEDGTNYYYATTGVTNLNVSIGNGNWGEIDKLRLVVPSSITFTGGLENYCVYDEYYYTLSTGPYVVNNFVLSKNGEANKPYAVALDIPTSVEYVGGFLSKVEDIYYAGTSTKWADDVVLSSSDSLSNGLTIHCSDMTGTYNGSTWTWVSNTPAPAPAPATGVELNIGVAIASLALVGTMFVVANKKRKEER